MPFLFGCTLFLSAALLMLVQPLCARQILPALGGTPNVWNTCLVFFQTGLLAGYGYAHWSARGLGIKGSVLVHLALLAVAFAMLPIHLPRPATTPDMPVAWLLQALLTGVAVPFAVIAASGPLLQRWFAAGDFGNPYPLYVASNAGSFAGLLAYPFLVEPLLTLPEQSDWWRWGCLGLVAATLMCGLVLLPRRIEPGNPSLPKDPPPPVSWRERFRWLILAFVPSSLLLSVTNYLTTDIAAMPLLWIVPLALYLLTFVLVFSARPIFPHALSTRWQPLAVIVLMLLLLREASEPLLLVLLLHLAGFFWIALACHGELSRSRPDSRHLTEFYLWLAVGGALGGTFNTLIAPMVFSTYAEYPLMIAAAAALRPSADATRFDRSDGIVTVALGFATCLLILLSAWLELDAALKVFFVYLAPLVTCYLLQHRPLRFGLAVGAVLLASSMDPGIHGRAAVRMRSFFGVHRVTEHQGMRRLVHGNTVHGQQFLDAKKSRQPLAYYHESGPIGWLLKDMKQNSRLQRVGLVGLGAGALAAYAQPRQRWTFLEIDPTVVHIARDSGLFTFLRDSRGELDFVVGDARLTLQRETDTFGMLILDAFGSDAIPWHLLTREALQLYRLRLQDDGILAFHISNRYVNLEPVLANHAADMGLECTVAQDLATDTLAQHPGKLPSIWLFLAKRRVVMDGAPFHQHRGRADPNARRWTDDFANLIQVLHWHDPMAGLPK